MGQVQTGGRPIDSLEALPAGTPAWGAKWKQAMRDNYLSTVYSGTGVHGSCQSYRQNHLDLDPTHKDRFGRPLVRMTMDFPENEIKMSAFLTDRYAEIIKAMGAHTIEKRPRKAPYDVTEYHAVEPSQHGGQRHRVESISAAPAEGIGGEARDRARREDPDHEPAHDIADDAPALHRGCETCSGRDQHLDRARRGADGKRGNKEQSASQRERCRGKSDDLPGNHRQNDAPELNQIGQGHQQKRTDGITKHGHHADEAVCRHRNAKRRADQGDDRLRRIKRQHDHADGSSEKQRQIGSCCMGRAPLRLGELPLGRACAQSGFIKSAAVAPLGAT